MNVDENMLKIQHVSNEEIERWNALSGIGDGSVTTDKIANDAVTADKIANVNRLGEAIAIGTNAEALNNAIAIGRDAFAIAGTRIAIGREARAEALGGVAIGAGTLSSHNHSVVLMGANGVAVVTATTSTNQILLGGTSHTPFAHRALSVISDQRDKAEISPLKYNALEFINKVEPKQYKLDFRADYTRQEEITETEYQELDNYTKQHRVRDIPVYSIDNEVEFIEYSFDDEEDISTKSSSNNKFKTIIKSNVLKSREEAINKYKDIQLSKRNGLKAEDLTEKLIEQKITKVRDMNLLRVFLPKDGSKTNNRYHNGVLAQQVKQVADEMGFDFCGYKDHAVNGGDDLYSISYEEFIAPMIGAIQQLTKKVEAQEEIIKDLVNTKMKEVQ